MGINYEQRRLSAIGKDLLPPNKLLPGQQRSGKRLTITILYPKILWLREKVRSHGKYLAFLATSQSKLNIREEELFR